MSNATRPASTRRNFPGRRAVLAGGAALGAAALAHPAIAAPLHKLTFSLDFIPLGRHAPWYAAVAAGYYREEGLDVTIIPSQGTAQTLQAIDSGLAQLGLADVPTLVLAHARGSTIKVVTVNYQKSPYAVFSLSPGADVHDLKQLEGLHLGSGSGSFTPRIIRGMMTERGLDPKSLVVVNVAPSARASLLLTHQIPAIEFFIMSKSGLEAGAKKAGEKLVTFFLADHGLDLYSLGIGGTAAFLDGNKAVVEGFVRASLRGWKLAMDNPDKAAALQHGMLPTLSVPGILAEIAIVRELAVTPDTEKHGLGWFSSAKMAASTAFSVKYIGVEGTPPAPTDIYELGFLPKVPILP